MSSKSFRLNLVALARIIEDSAPGFVVRTELYVRLRRLLSSTPQRFVEPETPATGSTAGQFRGRKLVSARTDLCIEGFPGSANSFVSNCVRDAVDDGANIESHFHQRAQLRRALAFGVPAVVIVRDPRGACSSLKSKEPRFWDWVVILRWVLYHRFVLRNRRELQLFLFEDLIRDVDLVRRRSPAVRRLARRRITPDPRYVRPSGRRHALREEAPVNRMLLRIADRVFERVSACARVASDGSGRA